MLSNLLQGILSNWITWVIAVVGAFVLGYLKKNYPGWASIALYALAGSSLLVFIFLAAKAWRAIPSPQVQIDDFNLEENLSYWLKSHNVRIGSLPPDDKIPLQLVVSDDRNKSIIIYRSTSIPRTVLLRAGIKIGAEQAQQIKDLPEGQGQAMIRRLRIELARADVTYSGISLPLDSFELMDSISYSFLNEETLSRSMDKLYLAVVLATETVSDDLARYGSLSRPSR